MCAKHVFVVLGLGMVSLAGCLSPVRQDTDALLCHRAGLAVDLLPPGMIAPEKPPVKPPDMKPPDGKPLDLRDRLNLPASVPGWDAPVPVLPPGFEKFDAKQKDAFLAKYFPPQLSMGPEPKPAPGPDGHPLTLADLQRLARATSPLLRQAAANIKVAEGAALEAGLYPNPTIGIGGNAAGPSGGPVFGPTISQTIKTMGKLKLAQAAATMDLANAQLAYRRAETDLMGQVRQYYFAVLAAETAIKINRGLADLTDEVFKVMLQQRKAGELATYEPMQVSVFAAQARIALVQSRNQYLLSWKQLAAALGRPEMPATEVAGSLERNLPRFDYEKTLAHVLANHTDALTALYTIEKARYNLRLAQVTPIPDVTLSATVNYDATAPGPNRFVTSFGGSVPVPFFDRNQGGIKQAQGQLLFAVEQPHVVQAALTASVSDAYKRLEENRFILEVYRKQMLPQQAQAFRATVHNHFGAGPAVGAAFTDLISAEQNVVSLIATYLTTLQAYWQAVSDLASWLQTDDVYEMATEVSNSTLPDLAELLKLPCCHPCSGLPSPTAATTLSFEAPPGQRTAPNEPNPGPMSHGSSPAPPAVPASPLAALPASSSVAAPATLGAPTFGTPTITAPSNAGRN
jgi:cobalt-zinc-cadmium efflux system outer membrane protein